jgi:uncharacterized protein YkwD
MQYARRLTAKPSAWLVYLLMTVFIAGCGGGGGDNGAASSQQQQPGNTSTTTPNPLLAEAGAPQQTGDMTTDGHNWINFRRQQMGLAPVSRNTLIDKAAQAHSTYQAINDTITHDEVQTKRGFTGATLFDRLRAAQYPFPPSNIAYGEVISAAVDTSGLNAAEDLVAAIYHRIVIFEPKFLEAGAGVAAGNSGYNYFTIDYASLNLGQGGLGSGRLVTYPFANQQNVPDVFFSDQEEPDPVPDRNEVGYPVSVHADIISTISVQTFTISPRGGAPLATKLLTHEKDPEIGEPSAAAIIPLAVLQRQTFYDVQFIGTVDGVPVNLFWSFKTR